MAFIRPYKESDFDACAHICRSTLPPTLSANPITVKLSPYLWTHQYTHLSPQTCHILDDGAGTAVGYCIGCPDVFAFVAGYQKYVDKVLAPDVVRPDDMETREPWLELDPSMGPDLGRMVVNPVAMAQTACHNPKWLLLEGQDFLTSKWRATMHIDMLEPYQDKGWGRKLIERFVESVQASGADYGEGEHIGIAGENSKVVKFYERVGFRLVAPPGQETKEPGEGGGTINMVRDIAKKAS